MGQKFGGHRDRLARLDIPGDDPIASWAETWQGRPGDSVSQAHRPEVNGLDRVGGICEGGTHLEGASGDDPLVLTVHVHRHTRPLPIGQESADDVEKGPFLYPVFG